MVNDWTDDDFQQARQAFKRAPTSTNRQVDDAIRAALKAVVYRLQPLAPAISDVVLEAMERDGWTPTQVRALIADYRRLAGSPAAPRAPTGFVVECVNPKGVVSVVGEFNGLRGPKGAP